MILKRKERKLKCKTKLKKKDTMKRGQRLKTIINIAEMLKITGHKRIIQDTI